MPFRLDPARDLTLFRLVEAGEQVRLVKGRSLYSAGDEATDVWLVREGHVRLVLPGMRPGERERSVSLALPWETFGDEALTQGRRRYGAIAGSSCVVSPLPKAAVLHAMKTAKGSLGAYLEGRERELYRLRHAQGGSHGPDASQRLAEVVIDLSARCGESVGRSRQLTQRFTHQLLGDLAGVHRATVTTLLNDWLYDGVLTVSDDHRLVLRKPSELWVLAGYQSPA